MTAFTATATTLVEEDMKRSLGLKNAVIFRTGLDRPNLSFRVISGVSRKDFIGKYVKTIKKRAGSFIVRPAKRLMKFMVGLKKTVSLQDGTMQVWTMKKDGKRRKIFPLTVAASWWQRTLSVWESTRAMSAMSFITRCRKVWKPTIRRREERAGRCGGRMYPSLQRAGYENPGVPDRYGKPAGGAADTGLRTSPKMTDYCLTTDCLRNYILRYFGEAEENLCGHCGNCENAVAKADITD